MKTVFDVSISLLTPLHIGSGKELLRDYDYVTYGGRTWVIQPDTMLEFFQKPDGSFDERLLGRPAAELLMAKDFDLENKQKLFRYILPGQPRAQGHGAVLREQYKDAFDRPYIPGSSLKGALRTLLAWHGFQERKLRLNVDNIRAGRSWAGQALEREIFGADPNRDLLRGLQVADSEPVAAERLQIINAQVVTGSEQMGAPIEVEAVRGDTVFTTTVMLDEFLHSPAAEQQLHFGERWNWLEQIPEIARAWGIEHLRRERDWFRQRKYEVVSRLYHQMVNALGKLPSSQFFLQIGWGGGWNNKTIGYLLQTDDKAWERLLGDKRLSPARFRRRPGDPFPKSRRVVTANRQVAAPLGWCLVEMKGKA